MKIFIPQRREIYGIPEQLSSYQAGVGTTHIESSIAATMHFRHNSRNHRKEAPAAMQRLNNQVSVEAIQYSAITER
jgi:hypothetical protein